MTKGEAISRMILDEMSVRMNIGDSQQEALRVAIDRVLGAGTHERLVGDVYAALRGGR